MKPTWKKQFKEEFGIHFKNSPDELGFAIAFISDLFEAQKPKTKTEDWEKFSKVLCEDKHAPTYEASHLDKIFDAFNEVLEAQAKEIIKEVEKMKVPVGKMKHDLQCKCDYEKNNTIQEILTTLKQKYETKN